MPEIFLCSTKEVSVHNLGCPVVSRVTFFLRFFRRPSAVSAPFWMTSYVMRNSNRAPRGFRISRKADI